MVLNKVKAAFELIRKAWYIWAVQYHFVIPREILKMYVHKFTHESKNITKYSNRFFDPENDDEYRKWLSYREAPARAGRYMDAVRVEETEKLDLSRIDSEYVCVISDGCRPYPWFGDVLKGSGDVFYFDHDSLDHNNERCNPVLKPDFSFNTLRSFNYIGRCFVAKTELMKQFEGQTWNPYGWLLRLSSQKVSFVHISEIAYSDNKPAECEIDTLKQYLVDINEEAEAVVNPDGISCTVRYKIKGIPLISLLIPTKDSVSVLKTCINSIYSKTTYPNFEIIVGDNNSEKTETFEYFEELQNAHENCRVIRIESPFNFSYINNRMAEAAAGDYYVLLNNDTEIITPDWLEQMLSYAQRDNVGSVGALLYYSDDTIQHGGVIVGKGGAAAHRWYRCEKDVKDYLYTLKAPNDVSCCTAACLMTGRKRWDEMNGLNEELTVQFNDVDYGLRLLKAGYFNVFMPSVELYHYESKSRGIDKDKKAVERFFKEVHWFEENYGGYIIHDPFYNDGFDKNYDYKLIAGTGSN